MKRRAMLGTSVFVLAALAGCNIPGVRTVDVGIIRRGELSTEWENTVNVRDGQMVRFEVEDVDDGEMLVFEAISDGEVVYTEEFHDNGEYRYVFEYDTPHTLILRPERSDEPLDESVTVSVEVSIALDS